MDLYSNVTLKSLRTACNQKFLLTTLRVAANFRRYDAWLIELFQNELMVENRKPAVG